MIGGGGGGVVGEVVQMDVGVWLVGGEECPDRPRILRPLSDCHIS